MPRTEHSSDPSGRTRRGEDTAREKLTFDSGRAREGKKKTSAFREWKNI